MSLLKNEQRLDHSQESLHHKVVDAIKHDTVRWFHFYSLFSFTVSLSIATHSFIELFVMRLFSELRDEAFTMLLLSST